MVDEILPPLREPTLNEALQAIAFWRLEERKADIGEQAAREIRYHWTLIALRIRKNERLRLR